MPPQIVVDRVVVERHDGLEWLYYSPGHPNVTVSIHIAPNTPVARIDHYALPQRGAGPVLRAFITKALGQLKATKNILRVKPLDPDDVEVLKSAGFTREPTGDYSLLVHSTGQEST